MAAPSVTNTFVANTTASASEVNANFSDIIDGLSSGSTWDVVVDTLTASTSITGTLATAAQANVTSLGTLTALNVSGTTSLDGAVTINDSGADVDFRVEGDTNQNLLFCDASTDRVGIGTSSPATPLDISKDDQTNGAILRLTQANGGSWSDDIPIASLEMYSSDPSGSGVKAAIQSLVDTSGGGNYINHSKLEFKTCRTNSLSTKMTIDSNGKSTFSGVVDVDSGLSSFSVPGLIVRKDSTSTSTNEFIEFYRAGTTANGGIHNTSSTAVDFFTASDRRIKTNITDLSSTLNKILALRPVSYKMKDIDENQDGFIAQELYEVFPHLVTKTDDGAGSKIPDGFKPWRISSGGMNGMICYLTKAIQEQQAIIDAQSEQLVALTARIEALEAK